jgi:hypothetical protein
MTHSSIVEENQNNCRRKNCRTSHLLRGLVINVKKIINGTLSTEVVGLNTARYWIQSKQILYCENKDTKIIF